LRSFAGDLIYRQKADLKIKPNCMNRKNHCGTEQWLFK